MVRTGKEVHHGVDVKFEVLVQGSDDMGDAVGFRNGTALLDATVCDRGQFDPVANFGEMGQIPVPDRRDHAGPQDAHSETWLRRRHRVSHHVSRRRWPVGTRTGTYPPDP